MMPVELLIHEDDMVECETYVMLMIVNIIIIEKLVVYPKNWLFIQNLVRWYEKMI